MEPLAYLGISVRYPITVTAGRIQTVTGKDVIESSFIMILTTPVGSRYFLPEYGCRINELFYEPNDDVLKKLLQLYIVDSLTRWETRAKIVSINIITDLDSALCFICYKILGSNEINSFVFPYYKRKLDL